MWRHGLRRWLCCCAGCGSNCLPRCAWRLPKGARQTALVVPLRECDQIQKHPAGSGPKTASEALQTFRQKMPCLGRCNAPKRDTGVHILTAWPFCHVKSAIEHKRRYARRVSGRSCPVLRSPRHPAGVACRTMRKNITRAVFRDEKNDVGAVVGGG